MLFLPGLLLPWIRGCCWQWLVSIFSTARSLVSALVVACFRSMEIIASGCPLSQIGKVEGLIAVNWLSPSATWSEIRSGKTGRLHLIECLFCVVSPDVFILLLVYLNRSGCLKSLAVSSPWIVVYERIENSILGHSKSAWFCVNNLSMLPFCPKVFWVVPVHHLWGSLFLWSLSLVCHDRKV